MSAFMLRAVVPQVLGRGLDGARAPFFCFCPCSASAFSLQPRFPHITRPCQVIYWAQLAPLVG